MAYIHDFERELFEYLVATKDGLLADIRKSGVLSEQSEKELREAILYCKEKFLGK